MKEYVITLYFRDGRKPVKIDYKNREMAKAVFYNHITDPLPEVWRVVLSRVMLVQIDSWEE